MKNKHTRSPKLRQNFEIGRFLIWPMVLIGWGMAGYAIFLTLTHTGLQ